MYNVCTRMKKKNNNTRSEQFSHCHATTLYAQKDLLYGVVNLLFFFVFLWQNWFDLVCESGILKDRCVSENLTISWINKTYTYIRYMPLLLTMWQDSIRMCTNNIPIMYKYNIKYMMCLTHSSTHYIKRVRNYSPLSLLSLMKHIFLQAKGHQNRVKYFQRSNKCTHICQYLELQVFFIWSNQAGRWDK